MGSYLLRHMTKHSYLEYTPAEQRFSWLATTPRHASLFTLEAATLMVGRYPGEDVRLFAEDRWPPEFDVETLPAEVAA